MDNKISIVIATKSYSNNLFRTIKLINRQTYFPKEVIIVSNKRINQNLKLNKYITFKIFTSKIKNQVYQRNIAIKNISKDSDLILQLDDRILLNKDCLFELNKFWKKVDNSVIGVGLNQINKFKERGLFNKISHYFKIKGKVLSNGINIDYSNLTKDLNVMWLKGGLSSWKINKNKNLTNRKYPYYKWSVFEDVELSLNKKKKQKLLVCYKAKAEVLERTQKINLDDLIYRGSIYTFSQRRLVKKFLKIRPFFI